MSSLDNVRRQELERQSRRWANAWLAAFVFSTIVGLILINHSLWWIPVYVGLQLYFAFMIFWEERLPRKRLVREHRERIDRFFDSHNGTS